MPKLIKDHQIVEDDWSVLPKDAELGQVGERCLVPLKLWLEHTDSLRERLPAIGVWIDSDEDVVELAAEDCHRMPVIGVNFPAFADGRSFSTARLLRDRFRYQGEVRALGDFMRDQLFYLQRCGCNAFAPTNPWPDFESSLASLHDFSEPYQAASDLPKPLYERHQRG